MGNDRIYVGGGYRVSILVFVELALDDYSGITGFLDNLGFNPCFRGTCS